MNLRKWSYKGEFQDQIVGSLSKEKAEWPHIHTQEDALSSSHGRSLLRQPRYGKGGSGKVGVRLELPNLQM